MSAPNNPRKYVGPDQYLVPVVSRSRAPTTADYRQPETGRNYVAGTIWQVGKNPSTGTFGDLWFLSKIVANQGIWVEMVTGVTRYPITPYVVGPVGIAGYQTIQSALTAANIAGGGIVYVQPGTYTENLTLYGNVHVVGVSSNSDFATAGNSTIISGVHTPPLTGSFTFANTHLVSATHVFSSTSAGSAALFCINCSAEITNGYLYNLLNWTGFVGCYNFGENSTNNGVVNNTGGAVCFFISATLGAGSGNTMVTSGPVTMQDVDLNCPWTAATGSVIDADYNVFSRTVTAANNTTGAFRKTIFSTGSSAALTMSSSAAISVLDSVITSSNNPAIAGAGAGILTLGGNTFTSNALKAGTLTIAYASMDGVLATTNTAGASPQIVNARTGQVAFTDVIANGAYGTLTLTDSVISSTSVVLASVSCTTVNSALQIVGTVPGSGSVDFRIFNAGSASTDQNILVNFWVLN